jgi:glycerol-3-phosphate dehydrogenase
METLSADVLVIGGGATGAGVAWDAALRGLSVVLVDRHDLAQGTSGRFHGLLHSGGRYVIKDPVAAAECAAENPILRRVAAACIEDTGGLFVTTPDDDPDYADRFAAACAATGVPCQEIATAEALRQEPRLNPGITRAFRVLDATSMSGRRSGRWPTGHVRTAHGFCRITRSRRSTATRTRSQARAYATHGRPRSSRSRPA